MNQETKMEVKNAKNAKKQNGNNSKEAALKANEALIEKCRIEYNKDAVARNTSNAVSNAISTANNQNSNIIKTEDKDADLNRPSGVVPFSNDGLFAGQLEKTTPNPNAKTLSTQAAQKNVNENNTMIAAPQPFSTTMAVDSTRPAARLTEDALKERYKMLNV